MDADRAEMLNSNEHNHDIIGSTLSLESVFQRHKRQIQTLW